MNENIYKLIYDLEIALLASEVRSSREKLDVLLADDFKEFGSSGEEYSKQDILEQLPEATKIASVEFLVSDFQVQQLAEDIVLATFTTDKKMPDNSRVVSLRSSIWRKTGKGWQMVFHQGTPWKN
ncbi:MAG: DUF4440 domain-containing protein [Bacillota bacterium]